MANDFLDALGADAEKRAKEYLGLLDQILDKTNKAASVQIGGKTPSGTDNAVKQLQNDYLQLENTVKNYQKTIIQAAAERKKVNVQERVDNSILLQQEKQQATLLSEVAGAYRKLSAQEAISARTVQDLIARGKLATQTQRQYNAELAKAQKEFNGYRTRILAADAATGRWARTNERTIAGARELAGALGFALGIGGVVALGREIFNVSKELQSLDLALLSVTGSEEKAAAQQEYLTGIAQKYGLEIKNLTQLYTQFYVAAKDKLAGQEIQDIFENIGKSGSALGLSNEALQRSFTAINQMLSKGTVSAEELRGQLAESLPGAVQSLLLAVKKLNPELKNLTEKGLFDMIKQGKILSSEVLPEMARQLVIVTGADKAEGIDTLAKATNRLSNAWTDLIRSFTEGDSVITNSIALLINKISEAVKGAGILIAGEEKRRNDELAAIRKGGYDQQKADYAAIENLDKEYVAKKNAFFQSEITRLQDEVRAYKEANETIKEVAQKRYVPGAQEQLAENTKQTILLNNQIKSYYGRIAAGTEILNANNKAVKKNTELTKEQLKAIEDANKLRYQVRLAELELEQQVIDRTLNDEETFYSVRLAALEKHRIKRIEILTLQFNEEVRLSKGNNDKQKLALIKYHSEVLKEIESFNKKQSELESLQLQPEAAVDLSDPDALKKQTELEIEGWNKKRDAVNAYKQGLEDLQKVFDAYAEGFVSSFFGDLGMTTLFDILTEKVIGFGYDAKVTALAISEAFQEMYNFLSKISQENFEAEYARVERQKDIAIEFAGESEAAKVEAAEQADKAKAKIRQREAKAEKQLALFNAVIDTAQAVVAALPRIPLSIAVGLIGAAQIAYISAQQIPEFWKGTDNAPGGWAFTQERGAEIITDKTGKIKTLGSSKGAQLTMLDKGDKVFTSDKTRDILDSIMFDKGLNTILNDRGINMPAININSLTPEQYFNGVARTEAAIRNFQPIHITKDRRGEIIHTQGQNGHAQSMNNRLHITGKINP